MGYGDDGLVLKLCRSYNGSLCRYDYLNIPARKAVDVYFKQEHENAVGINRD